MIRLLLVRHGHVATDIELHSRTATVRCFNEILY